MDGVILDKNFQILGILDQFTSFLWVDRFFECGSYEVTSPMDAKFIKLLKDGNYIWTRNSDRLMIVESSECKSNIEDGDLFISKGRSLESILTRRVIWGYTVLSGNLQNGIQKLLNENAINPSNPNRKIPYLEFVPSNNPKITEKTFEGQFFGQNLYDVIVDICRANDLGWRILPDIDNKRWKFELLYGTDYSYNQDERSWVVFSENYENLSDSNYVYSRIDYKTAVMVGGEGEGDEQEYIEVFRDGENGNSGLERRELYISASGSSYDSELTEEQRKTKFHEEMIQQGKDKLNETNQISAYDGVIDATRQFVYGRDFTLGDIVQVVNKYGMESSARIVEIMQSHDENGYEMVPTFESINFKEDE